MKYLRYEADRIEKDLKCTINEFETNDKKRGINLRGVRKPELI
jgi:hypothetical protein